MGIISNISSIALKPAEWLGSALTSGLELITGKKYIRTTSEEAAQTTFGKVLGSATAITGTGLLIASGVGATLIPKTLGGKAVAVVGSATILQSERLTKATTKLPQEVVSLTSNVSQLIDEPSIENVKKTITESPIASAILGGAAALTIGKGVGGIVSTILNTQATKENTQAMTTPQIVSEGKVVSEKEISTNEGIPITPETQTISTGKKRYKRAKKTISPSIKNSVRVNIINHSVGAYNRKFIKVGQLA